MTERHGPAGWGRTHHAGTETQRVARAVVDAHRTVVGVPVAATTAPQERPRDVLVSVYHHRAGTLRLVADGEGQWWVRVGTMTYGTGRRVGRRERRGDVLTPSKKTIEAAALVALREGPEAPPSFTGGDAA